MTKIYKVKLPFFYEGGSISATSEMSIELVAEGSYQIAIGALADIAFSDDMTLELAQKKAKRIYEELSSTNPRSWASQRK